MGQFRRPALIAALIACLAGPGARGQPTASPAIDVIIGDTFGSFALVNRGPSVQLRAAVRVERLVDGAWRDAAVSNFYLVSDCAQARSPVPTCISLAAGATLRPVPWRGNFCYAQCPVSCELDGPLPVGEYRFVVSTCDGTQQFTSPPFRKSR